MEPKQTVAVLRAGGRNPPGLQKKHAGRFKNHHRAHKYIYNQTMVISPRRIKSAANQA